MAQRFTGDNRHKLDSKGRVSIPAHMRRVLEANDAKWSDGGNPRLYIAHGDADSDGYVKCLSGDAFDEIDGIIQGLQRGSELQELLATLYYENTFPLTIDESGRLVVPPLVREKLDLGEEVRFRGRGDMFLLSKPEEGETTAEKIKRLRDAVGVAPGVDPLSLVAKAGAAL